MYGPLDLDARRGEILVLTGDEGSGRTSLLLTLAGRMKAKAGDLTVLGHTVRSGRGRPGFRAGRERIRLQRNSSVALIEGVDEPDESLKVSELISEAAGLQLPTLSRGSRGVSRAPRRLLAAVFEPDEIDRVTSAKVWQLSALDVVRLRIAIALVGRPALLCVDDVAVLRSPDDQRHLWACLQQIAAAGTTLVVVTSNTAAVPLDVTRVPMGPAPVKD